MAQAITDFYRKFGYFGGRTGLRFYRLAVAYNAVMTLFMVLIGFITLSASATLSVQTFLWSISFPALWTLAHLLPLLALQARRMHDLGQSGAAVLIPGAGIKMFWQKGDSAENHYGPAPTD